jgi:hypothetical protein
MEKIAERTFPRGGGARNKIVQNCPICGPNNIFQG